MPSAAKKNRARALLASRTLIKLGAGRTPRARKHAGDLRDAQRVRYLMDHCKEKLKIPAFLTVPTSQWYAPLPPSPFQGFPRGSRVSFLLDRGRTSVAVLTALCDLLSYILHPVADRHIFRRNTRDDKLSSEAASDPLRAYDVLLAIRERSAGVSERLLKMIWLLRQPEVCPEFRELTDLNDAGELNFNTFRLADSLEGSAQVFLPDGFMNFEDYTGGGFYVTALAAECGDVDRVVEVALGALEDKSQTVASRTCTDGTFVRAVREGVKAPSGGNARCGGNARYALLPYSGVVFADGRNHTTRFEEKARSEQLFGRFGRELVLAAGGDAAASSNDAFFAEVEKKMAVMNRVFMSRRLFDALAIIGGDAYRRDDVGISALEEDVEGMVAALTGGMIEQGGLNVSLLGCEAGVGVDGESRGKLSRGDDGRAAWRLIREVAFTEAAGGDDAAFDAAHARVKTSLAKEVFARDERLKRRLVDMLERIEKEGLDVLASADAKAFRAQSRAPPTFEDMEAGTFARALSAVGGRKAGKKNLAKQAAVNAAMSAEERLAHAKRSKVGGGCHAAMSAEEKRAHITEDNRWAMAIARYKRRKAVGNPVKVVRVRFDVAGKTLSCYTSRDASVDHFNAINVYITRAATKEIYDIVHTGKTTGIDVVLPLSDGADCEGVVIGGKKYGQKNRKNYGAWQAWSHRAFSALRTKGVKWSIEDDIINDDVVAEFDAAKKLRR